MAQYCPNCYAELANNPAECGNCSASFGVGSAWTPTEKPLGQYVERSRRDAGPPGAKGPYEQLSSGYKASGLAFCAISALLLGFLFSGVNSALAGTNRMFSGWIFWATVFGAAMSLYTLSSKPHWLNRSNALVLLVANLVIVATGSVIFPSVREMVFGMLWVVVWTGGAPLLLVLGIFFWHLFATLSLRPPEPDRRKT